LYDASTWQSWHYIIWIIINFFVLELTNYIFRLIDYLPIKKIPIQGPHLDILGFADYAYLFINKSMIPLFVYHMIQFSWYSDTVYWSSNPSSILLNMIVIVPLIFITYDFIYTIFHRGLHHPRIYRFIHKHHHKQNAPSRGFDDAINTHPFEYMSGQWNHILAIYLVGKFFPVHVISVLIFMFFAMLMAGLNHTRLDIGVSGIYEVKHHDAHHRFPNNNFGQYLVFWDRLTGSFRESRDKK